MKIFLNDFESIIDLTILQRGRDYFKRGLVVDLEEVEKDICLINVTNGGSNGANRKGTLFHYGRNL